MQSADGKFYNTDAANVETILRLIQSVSSKKAEPVKLWLAKIGYERMQEVTDPEIALNRSREYWQKQGRSVAWIQQRMMGTNCPKVQLSFTVKNNKIETQIS